MPDDERLKQGKTVFGKDYFDELLERIREIRASERRSYQKITGLCALSVDYSAKAPQTCTIGRRPVESGRGGKRANQSDFSATLPRMER